MSALPKVILVGGEPREAKKLQAKCNVTHYEKDRYELPKGVCPEAKALVLIQKAIPKGMFVSARKLCKGRGIPFLQVRSGNYALDALMQAGVVRRPASTNGKKLPKIILLGGDGRSIKKLSHLLEVHHVEKAKVMPSLAVIKTSVAVVVLTKWTGTSTWQMARKLGQHHGIPVVKVRTANYVIDKLVDEGVIERSKPVKAVPDSPQKPVDAPTSDPKPDTGPKATGLSHEDLWESYGPKAIEFTKDLLKPGDKLKNKDFLDWLSEYLGIPVEELEEFVYELTVRGLLLQTTDETLKVPGDEYEYEEDEVEAKSLELEPVKAVERGRHRNRDEMALLLAGLPEGPYLKKAYIHKEIYNYKEFLNVKGDFGVYSRVGWWINLAEEAGIIEKVIDGFKVNHDPDIQLTKLTDDELAEIDLPHQVKNIGGRTGGGAHKTYRARQAIKKPEPVKRKAYYAPVELDKEESEAKIEAAIKQNFKAKGGRVQRPKGLVVPVGGMPQQAVRLIKPILRENYWDECAMIAMGRIALPNGYHPLKTDFRDEEWDALAWSAIKRFPVEVLVQALKDL